MDTKEQALEKALQFSKQRIVEGWRCEQHICDNCIVVEVDTVDNRPYKDRYFYFPYAPPREIPAKGVIVECWCENESPEAACARYSLGYISTDGWLCASQDKNGSGKLYWRHWRVVEGQGELVDVPYSGWCRGCVSAIGNEGLCKTCKATRPTNYEAK